MKSIPNTLAQNRELYLKHPGLTGAHRLLKVDSRYVEKEHRSVCVCGWKSDVEESRPRVESAHRTHSREEEREWKKKTGFMERLYPEDFQGGKHIRGTGKAVCRICFEIIKEWHHAYMVHYDFSESGRWPSTKVYAHRNCVDH